MTRYTITITDALAFRIEEAARAMGRDGEDVIAAAIAEYFLHQDVVDVAETILEKVQLAVSQMTSGTNAPSSTMTNGQPARLDLK